jgi:hypothetical protein
MAWPPDKVDGEVILAAHINAIRDSVQTWQGHVSANNFSLTGLSDLDVVTSFITGPGAITIRAQNAATFEGGELQLNDYDNSPGWKIDSANRNFRIFRGASTIVQIDNGTAAIKLYLGGTLKTLSVDGSGFVKAA